VDLAGYDEASERMLEIAKSMDGYLGLEFARSGTLGITVSYWRDLNSLRLWRENAEHLGVQLLGQKRFYQAYRARICLVEREYGWERGDPFGVTPDLP
jgi:heme-degrading monooxygenase HmoA